MRVQVPRPERTSFVARWWSRRLKLRGFEENVVPGGESPGWERMTAGREPAGHSRLLGRGGEILISNPTVTDRWPNFKYYI
jgi:hypothetical protein